ncbi:MAG: hypothetical protein MPJ50_06360 [Pirellulales bacterium]|nr:hypothetical protein [Pirellulales bacterium]
MKEAVESGQLVMLGVVQEQHPDRTRLYAQWQQLQWPILHDPINVIETAAVPMFVAIDEHGIVRSTRANARTFADEFLNKEFADDATAEVEPAFTADIDAWQDFAKHFESQAATDALVADVGKQRAANIARGYADGLMLWSEENVDDKAIATYELSEQLWPRPLTRFRLGVAHRARYETPRGQSSDFQQAIDFWNSALAEEPNQYIWRRRIQQYGPRLIKPYPFYDWVETAQADVSARGEEPIALRAPLSPAEIARPARQFGEQASATNPDPDAKILRDTAGLIATEATVVSTSDRQGVVATIHFKFTPAQLLKAHWNNEAEPMRLWIDPPEGWKVTQQLLEAPQGDAAETNEVRRLSVEIRSDKPITAPVKLSAFALYNVCEDLGGVCQFLRQDVSVEIKPPKYRNR